MKAPQIGEKVKGLCQFGTIEEINEFEMCLVRWRGGATEWMRPSQLHEITPRDQDDDDSDQWPNP